MRNESKKCEIGNSVPSMVRIHEGAKKVGGVVER